jgi:hypothetical protein
MINGFVNGGVYRHQDSIALDILILGNTYRCDDNKKIKIRFFFVSKSTGAIFQYTALPKKERGKIKVEDLKYWRRIK